MTRRYAEAPEGVGLHARIASVTRALARVRSSRLAPGDNGGGYVLHREWACWTLRPMSGWRSVRWVSAPPYSTRQVGRDDREAALDWMASVLGI